MRPMPTRLSRGLALCLQSTQGLAILCLPVTSFPLLSRLMGGTTVAPLVIVPIFILTVGWLPVFLLRGGRLPAESKPFLVFLIAALIATAAGSFLPLPSFKGTRPLNEEISALVTLAIGAATYLVFALWFRETGQFKWALQLVNWGGLVMLLWSFVQLYFILFNVGEYPAFVIRLQSLISTRSLSTVGIRTRISGFTYEPSWQAHVLNMVYLPYWLAASLTGYSSWRKVWKLSAENILLLGGMIILFFTKSRIGLLAFLLMAALLFYELNAWAVGWLHGRMTARLSGMDHRLGKWLPRLLGLAMVLVYVGLAVGIVVLMARIDPRMAKLLRLDAIPSNLLDFAWRVNFAERVVYWTAGWNVFARYPLLGVGLGNTGFFFSHSLPIESSRLSEILDILYKVSSIPNVKSFWIRLLSETGMIGFSLFTAWQVLLWQAGRVLRLNRQPLLRTFGRFGLFAILAFLAEGFSIDSFALPYLWVVMGLLTAAIVMARRTEN